MHISERFDGLQFLLPLHIVRLKMEEQLQATTPLIIKLRNRDLEIMLALDDLQNSVPDPLQPPPLQIHFRLAARLLLQHVLKARLEEGQLVFRWEISEVALVQTARRYEFEDAGSGNGCRDHGERKCDLVEGDYSLAASPE